MSNNQLTNFKIKHPKKYLSNFNQHNLIQNNISNHTSIIKTNNPTIPNSSFIPPKNINTIIPLHVYQTWHTKNLPTHMNNCLSVLKSSNPEFTFHLFDDHDCRKFIQDNFSIDVLKAFDQLNPGAYKADLWRCCILYKLGGIYLDIKFKTVNNFKLIYLTNKEYFVNDFPKNNFYKNTMNYGIYNGFMICLPNNPILLKVINQIVIHVNKRYYGPTSLSPTGPMLLKRFFSKIERLKFPLNFYSFYNNNNKKIQCIRFNNTIILEAYPSYRNELNNFSKTKHYSLIWENHNVYFEKSKKPSLPLTINLNNNPINDIQSNIEFIDNLSLDT